MEQSDVSLCVCAFFLLYKSQGLTTNPECSITYLIKQYVLLQELHNNLKSSVEDTKELGVILPGGCWPLFWQGTVPDWRLVTCRLQCSQPGSQYRWPASPQAGSAFPALDKWLSHYQQMDNHWVSIFLHREMGLSKCALSTMRQRVGLDYTGLKMFIRGGDSGDLASDRGWICR